MERNLPILGFFPFEIRGHSLTSPNARYLDLFNQLNFSDMKNMKQNSFRPAYFCMKRHTEGLVPGVIFLYIHMLGLFFRFKISNFDFCFVFQKGEYFWGYTSPHPPNTLCGGWSSPSTPTHL